MFSTLAFGVGMEIEFLINLAAGNPVGAETATPFSDYDFLRQVKVLLGILGYGLGWWALLLFITVPVALLLMFGWSRVIHLFPKLEQEYWIMIVGLLGLALLGTLLRKVGLNSSMLVANPLYFFTPSVYSPYELTAFGVGFLLPRIAVPSLKLGAFLSTGPLRD